MSEQDDQVDELDLDIVVNDPYPCPNGVLCLDRGSFLLSTLPIESTTSQQWKHQMAFNKTNRIAIILPGTSSEVGVFRLKDIEQSCQLVENVLLDKAKTPVDKREAVREIQPLRKLKLDTPPRQVFMNQLGDIAVLTAEKQLVWFSTKETKPSHIVQQVSSVQISSQGSWVAYCTDLDSVLLCGTDFSAPITLEIGEQVTAMCFCDNNESLLCVATNTGRAVLFENGNELVSFTLEDGDAISTLLWPEDQLLAYATLKRFKIIELSEDLGQVTLGRFASDPLLQSPHGKCELEWFIEFNAQWRCFFLASTWSDSVCVVGFDDYGGEQGTDWVQWNLKRGMESGFPQVSVLEQHLHHVSDRLPSTEDSCVAARVLGMMGFAGNTPVSPFFVLKNNEEIEGKQDYAAPIPSVLVVNSEGICQLVGFVDCTPTEERDEYEIVEEENEDEDEDEDEEDEEEEEYVEVEDPPLFQEKTTTPEPLGSAPPPPATPFSFAPKANVAATPFSFTSKTDAAAAPFSFSSKPEAAAAPATVFSFDSKPEATATPFIFASKPETAAATSFSTASKPEAAAAPPPATPFGFTSKPAVAPAPAASVAPFSFTSKPVAAKPALAAADVDYLTRQMEEMQVKLKSYEQEIARLKASGIATVAAPRNELSAKALQEPLRMNFSAPQTTATASTKSSTTRSSVKPQPNLASVYKELNNSFALRDMELQQCFNFDLERFPACCFDAEKYAQYTKSLFARTEETSRLVQDTLQMSIRIGFTIDTANLKLHGETTAAALIDDKLLQDLIKKKHILQHQYRRLRRELDLCATRKLRQEDGTKWTLQDDKQRATARLTRMSDLVHKLERGNGGDAKQHPSAVPPTSVESTAVVKSAARRFAPVTEISPLSPVVDVHMSVGEKLRETKSAVEQMVNEWQLHIAEVEKLQLKHKQITKAAIPPLPPPKPLAVKPKSAVKALDSAAFSKPPVAPEIKSLPSVAPTPAPTKEEEKPAPAPVLAPAPPPPQQQPAPAPAAAAPMDLKAELGAFYSEIGQAKDDATLTKLAQQYGAQMMPVLLVKLQEKYKDSFASKPQIKSAYDKLAEKINRSTVAAPASPGGQGAFSFAQPAAPAFQTSPSNINNPFQPPAAAGNNPFMAAPLQQPAFTSSSAAPQQSSGGFGLTAPPSLANTQQALTQFYQQYNPQKLSDVPNLLQKFQGKETEMWISLKKKYSQSSQFVDQILNATIGNSGMGSGVKQQPAFGGGGGFASSAFATPSSGFGSFANAPATPSSGFNNAFGSSGGFPQQQNAFSSSGFGNAGPAGGGGFAAVAASTPPGDGRGFGAFASSNSGGGGFGTFAQQGSAFGGGGGGAFSTPAPVNKNLSNAFSQMRG